MSYTFASVDVKQLVVAALKSDLPINNLPSVRVLKADPQGPSELPCIGVVRASDDEVSMTMADYADTAYDAPSQTVTTTQGTFFSESLELRVWHTNADERDNLYQVVKAILFANRLSFVQQGLLNVTLRAGRDEQDSSMSQAPTILYWGVITMSYLNPLNVDIQTTAPMITSVSDGGTLTP